MRPAVQSVFRVDEIDVAVPGGDPVRKQVVRHPGGAVILPRLADGRIVVIRNHRPAIGEALIELPAGTRRVDEDPQRTAARELEEETGYRAGRLGTLGSFYPSPGFLDECMHAFVAEDLAAGSQQLEPGEAIEVLALTESELGHLVASGGIRDAKTLAVLHLWSLRATRD